MNQGPRGRSGEKSRDTVRFIVPLAANKARQNLIKHVSKIYILKPRLVRAASMHVSEGSVIRN